MTDEQGFIVRLTALAKLCQFAIDEEAIGLYDRSLCPIGYARVNQALDEIMQTRKARDPFPSIRDIRDLTSPTLTAETAAQYLLTRVIEAVSLYGYSDPEGAREHLGESVWNALPGSGGWVEFCNSPETPGILRAQLRERILAQLKKDHPTGRVELPDLISPTTVHVLSAGNFWDTGKIAKVIRPDFTNADSEP